MESIEELVAGERCVGTMRFDPELELFRDHFPGFPVVPGVLVIESLAQISGKLIGYTVRHERGDWPFPILSMMEKVKFRRFIRPGEEIRLETRLLALREESAVVAVRARVGGRVHAQAEQTFVFNAVPLEDPADRERVEALERQELARLWPDYKEWT